MKVVIAMDSLKGSLTSMEAGYAIREGVLSAAPEAQVIVRPMADGGEGTTRALSEGLGGELVKVRVCGPQGIPVEAEYGIIRESKTAVMEMASAAGITLLTGEKRPLEATSYGVGEMILDAIGRDCRSFLIGIGGSATNDCGIGMLSALGFRFLDGQGKPVGNTAAKLQKVERILTEEAEPRLRECSFQIACDVTNPLCGENGATYIYGPQKGVTPELAKQLDGQIRQFALRAEEATGVKAMETPGAGAAGGLGFAFLSFLGAKLRPGISLVIDAVKLPESLEGADLVFTGEGRLDGQSVNGKTPVGVAACAKRSGALVVALAGSVSEDASACHAYGIDACFPILRQTMSLQEAMKPETAAKNLRLTGEQVTRLFMAARSEKTRE